MANANNSIVLLRCDLEIAKGKWAPDDYFGGKYFNVEGERIKIWSHDIEIDYSTIEVPKDDYIGGSFNNFKTEMGFDVWVMALSNSNEKYWLNLGVDAPDGSSASTNIILASEEPRDLAGHDIVSVKLVGGFEAEVLEGEQKLSQAELMCFISSEDKQ